MGRKVGTGREVVKSVSLPRTCRQSALFIMLPDFPPIRLQARGLIMGPPRPHIGYTLRGWRAGAGGGQFPCGVSVVVETLLLGRGGAFVMRDFKFCIQCRPIAS